MLYYSFPRLDSLQGVFVHSRSVLVLKGTGFGVREKTTTRYVDSVKFDAERHPHVAFTEEACPWIGALGSPHRPSSVGWSLAASSDSVSPSPRLNGRLFFVRCLRRWLFNREPITRDVHTVDGVHCSTRFFYPRPLTPINIWPDLLVGRRLRRHLQLLLHGA